MQNVIPLDGHIHQYADAIPNTQLYELALISSHCSRFKIDTHFKEGECERLYRCWIEKSVCGLMSDYVFCYSINNSIVGMVTLKIEIGYGTIGLIAVNPKVQSKGIGTALLNAVKRALKQQNIPKLYVATQMNNQQACFFYERNNMTTNKITAIYHYWHK